MARLVLITSDASVEERVRAALDLGHDGVVRQWREEYLRIDPSKVVEIAVEAGAEVVGIGPGLPQEDGLALAAAFDQGHPEVCVLLLADPAPALLEQAMHQGVRDVVDPDGSADALARTFNRALGTAERRRSNVLADFEPARARHRVAAVISPKGGAGKTTVATNLAVGLAVARPGRVALVDLDVQFGDVAAALALSPENSLADVARSGVEVDATMLKVFLTPHSSSLYTLCAPDTPAEGDEVRHTHASLVVRVLTEEFSTVVVDTPAGLDEITLAAIEQATDLVLVCTMDVASVRSLRKELDALDRLGMTAQTRHLVLNRADARVGIEVKDVEAILGMTPTAAIPGSRGVPLSMNQGVTMIESEPRSPVAKQLQALVACFEEPKDRQPVGRRRWGAR